jgi:hypothetical protein
MYDSKKKDLNVELIQEKAQRFVLTPETMSHFETNKLVELTTILNKLDVERLVNIKSRDEFDDWFEVTIKWFYDEIHPLYREGVNSMKSMPYGSTAKFLSEYIFCLNLYSSNRVKDFLHHFHIQHPIMNREFFHISWIMNLYGENGIKDKEHYYWKVKEYRSFIDDHKLDKYTLRLLISFDNVHDHLPHTANYILSQLLFLKSNFVDIHYFLKVQNNHSFYI